MFLHHFRLAIDLPLLGGGEGTTLDFIAHYSIVGTRVLGESGNVEEISNLHIHRSY